MNVHKNWSIQNTILAFFEFFYSYIIPVEDELLQSKPENPPRKEIHFLQVVLPSVVQLKCDIII